jgi:small subunit ribosomal protein S20
VLKVLQVLKKCAKISLLIDYISKGDTTVPNIKSAKKRVNVINKKTEINKSEKSAVKTAIKAINVLIDAGNYEEATKLLPQTFSILDKAVTKGIMHKNTASNKKSKIANKINALKASK